MFGSPCPRTWESGTLSLPCSSGGDMLQCIHQHCPWTDRRVHLAYAFTVQLTQGKEVRARSGGVDCLIRISPVCRRLKAGSCKYYAFTHGLEEVLANQTCLGYASTSGSSSRLEVSAAMNLGFHVEVSGVRQQKRCTVQQCFCKC